MYRGVGERSLGLAYDGLVSHPGREAFYTPSCYGNWDELTRVVLVTLSVQTLACVACGLKAEGRQSAVGGRGAWIKEERLR